MAMMTSPVMIIRIRARTTSSLTATRGSRKGRLEGKKAEITLPVESLSSSRVFLTRTITSFVL